MGLHLEKKPLIFTTFGDLDPIRLINFTKSQKFNQVKDL